MTFSDVLVVAIVGGIVSIGTTLLTTGMQGYKWKNGEGRKMDADTASTLTDTSLQIVKALREDVEALRKELADTKTENEILKDLRDKQITGLHIEMNELRQSNNELRENNYDLKDWAERLVHQLLSVDLEPVKIRASRPK